jgi:hypothetical protein
LCLRPDAMAVTLPYPGITSVTHITDNVSRTLTTLDQLLPFLGTPPVQPGPLQPAISVRFDETLFDLHLLINGGNIAGSSGTTSQTYNFTGTYWGGLLTITQTPGTFLNGDILTTNGTFLHSANPHPELGETRGGDFHWAYPQSPGGILAGNPLHGSPDRDNYFGRIGATYVGFGNKISSWDLKLDVNHPAPEPSTLLLTLPGIGIVLLMLRRRHRRAVSAQEPNSCDWERNKRGRES